MSIIDAQTCTSRLPGGERGILVVFGNRNFQFGKNELTLLPFIRKKLTECQLHDFQSSKYVKGKGANTCMDKL